MRPAAALLLLLAGLELGISLLALGVRETRAYRERLRREGPRTGLTVLCEGDSFTWGVGGRSYPEQLQEVLRERLKTADVEVVNAGVPGRTSGAIVRFLEEHLLAARWSLSRDAESAIKLASSHGASVIVASHPLRGPAAPGLDRVGRGGTYI